MVHRNVGAGTAAWGYLCGCRCVALGCDRRDVGSRGRPQPQYIQKKPNEYAAGAERDATRSRAASSAPHDGPAPAADRRLPKVGIANQVMMERLELSEARVEVANLP